MSVLGIHILSRNVASSIMIWILDCERCNHYKGVSYGYPHYILVWNALYYKGFRFWCLRVIEEFCWFIRLWFYAWKLGSKNILIQFILVEYEFCISDIHNHRQGAVWNTLTAPKTPAALIRTNKTQINFLRSVGSH